MGELTRFALIRDVQRREVADDAVVDLVSQAEASALFQKLEAATTGEAVSEACKEFLDAGSFVDPAEVEGQTLGRVSAWLRDRDDRASLRELVEESPLKDLRVSSAPEMQLSGQSSEDNQALARLAESLVVAMLQEDADPSVGPALHRLVLVAALAVQLLTAMSGTSTEAANPPDQANPEVDSSDADAHGDASRAELGPRTRTLRPLPPDDDTSDSQRELVHAALHDRVVLVPNWLTRNPKATAKVKPGPKQKLKRRSNLVREPAMSDFYIIEDEWARYEAAEIAHIENVLPTETKLRKHVRLEENEMATTTEEESSEVTEKDTQQTDSTEFTRATQEATKLAFGLDLSVDTQGQYGPTAVQTHLAAELDGSLESAEQTAFKVSRQIVAQAASKVSATTRTARTAKSLRRITESNHHTLSNGDSQNALVGIYRWVEQVRRLRVMRYPNRYLLEFLIPEPAAWWRWRAQRQATIGVTVPPVIPFTQDGKEASDTNPELSAADMTATFAPASDVSGPPPLATGGGNTPADALGEVPQACQGKAGELAALNAERAALFAEWDSVQSPGEKADLNQSINAIDAQILTAESELEACLRANSPPPTRHRTRYRTLAPARPRAPRPIALRPISCSPPDTEPSASNLPPARW